ncbi:MAG: TatD family hydrolase [bacterium]|nr:TatD family hydrolase [bacterium]
MSMRYFDAHCHVQFDQYAHDADELIVKMGSEGVGGIVVGVDEESSKKALVLAEKYEHLYASVGLHPNHVGEEVFDMSAYRALAEHPKVVAVGECGLDYYRPVEVNDEVKRIQKEVFKKHIELAALLHKPLIIHARPSKGTQDAYHDVITILQDAKIRHPDLRGDIHFFVGGVAEAEAFFVLDFTISFTAVITFARDYDAVIRAAPLDRILSETDAPYLAPASRRGERNDPFAVQDVVAKMAEIRGEDADRVRLVTLENSKRLFGIA